jgi:hypothetical protein
MSEEQPSFRLVNDNSAFVRKPGEPPVEVAARDGAMAEVDVSSMRLHTGAEEDKKEGGAPAAPSSTQRDCGGCSKSWPENYLVRMTRKEKGKERELWVCPVCERNKAYENTGTEKVRVSGGGSLDTTKLFIIFAVVLVVISSVIFWKFHNDTVNEKVDWIAEEWAAQPVDKWPGIVGQWEARVQGVAEPVRSQGFFLERRDGTVIAVGRVEPSWLSANRIKASKFSDLVGKVQATIRVAGKGEAKLGEFFRPKEPIIALWAMSIGVPAKQLPSEPLEVRRQAFSIGLAGTLVCLVGGKQTGYPARIIQGVKGGDEFVLEMVGQIPPESVPGSVLIDEFGHIVAVGAEVMKVGSARTGQRVYVRNALTLVGLEK